MEKTQFMSLNRRGREKEVDNVQIVVNVEVLVRCDKVQFLGVTVDRQLNWKDHIEGVRRKCLCGLAQLHRVKEALPNQLRKLLYQTLILPHLNYCAVVWAECSKTDEDKGEAAEPRHAVNPGQM